MKQAFEGLWKENYRRKKSRLMHEIIHIQREIDIRIDRYRYHSQLCIVVIRHDNVNTNFYFMYVSMYVLKY